MAQRDIELILARQLAGQLAVATLLVDAGGDTLFFNEPAERIYGRRFDEVDALPGDERSAILAPLRRDGRPVPLDQLPSNVAIRDRRPTHAAFQMHGLDGVLRPIEATAVPLESAGGRVLGALVFFWIQDDDETPARPITGPTSGAGG
ncbi:MAG: hypothetical protein ACRDGL_00260 [Candidatus Limnocylindrales bacterium]